MCRLKEIGTCLSGVTPDTLTIDQPPYAMNVYTKNRRIHSETFRSTFSVIPVTLILITREEMTG